MSYLGTKGKLARILQRFDRFCRCFKGNDSKFIREANTRKEYRRGCKEIRERSSFNQSWKRSFRRRALRLAILLIRSNRNLCESKGRLDISFSRMHFRWRIFWQTSLMFRVFDALKHYREKH